ncbi:MAG: hypothetical protein WKF94_11780 [Solirubrobacteraceae bacterium]
MDEDGKDTADARVEQLTAQLNAALAERNALRADAQRVTALELELVHTRAIIEEMKQSVSWRLTAPVRGAKTQGRTSRKLAGRVRRAVRAG